MSEQIEVGIVFKADGDGLVGEVKLSKDQFDKLGKSVKDAGKDTDKFARSTDLAKQKLNGFRNKSRELYNTLFSLKGLIATIGVGAIAKSFVEAASTAEQYRVRLKVLLGDVAEGNRLFQQMSLFASKVPFEYREIMAAATALAGVLQGGVNEISAWMPLIGDLAAASGLGIQQTTDQVIRMLSAGAASADLFRERGILAMLGFQAGVTYSGEQTRDQLIAAWGAVSSKFRGATEELADTWDGKMSMLSDKWFAFRNQVMDAGLFDYLKSMASTLDNDVGNAMNNNKDQAKSWSDIAIKGIENVIRALDVMLEAWNKILIGVKTLQLGFETIKFSATKAYNLFSDKTFDSEAERQEAIAGVDRALALLPEGAGDRQSYLKRREEFLARPLSSASDEAFAAMEKTQEQLLNLINKPDNFDADAKIKQIRDNSKQTADNAGAASENTDDLKAKVDALNNSKVENNELSKEELKDIEDIIAAGDKAAKQQKKEIEAKKKALESGVKALSESLMNETEAENRRHQEALNLLQRAEEQKLDTIFSYDELRERLETEHQENLQAIRDEATADQRAKLEEQAKQQAEILQEPFKNALRNIQNSFTDFYEDLFSGGVDSFSDLASAAKKIFIRLAAEMATLMTFRGIGGLLGGGGIAAGGSALAGGGLLSSLGSILSNPLGGVGSGGAIGGIGGGLLSLAGGLSSPGLASLAFQGAQAIGLSSGASSFIASGAGFLPAGVIGGLGANLLGLGSGNVIQDTLFGGAGSFIGGGLGGSFLTGLGAAGGPIGAIAGGFLGTALGGLFGGDKDYPYAHVRLQRDLSVSNIGALDGGSTKELNSAASQISLQLKQFADSIGASNVRLNKSISFGFASGRSSRLGSGFFVGGAGSFRKGADYINLSPEKAQELLFSEALSSARFGGVSKRLNDVINRSVKLNKGDLNKVAEDVKFARSILEDSASSVSNVTAQFKEMEKRARRLRLPLSKINKAITDQLTALETGVIDQLQSIATRAKQILNIDNLTSFRDSLQTGSLSPLSEADRFSILQQRFNSSAASALNGNVEALHGFPDIAQQLLTSGRSLYASGTDYQALFTNVNTQLNDVISKQQGLLSGFETGLAIRESADDQIRVLREEQEKTRAVLKEIQRELKKRAA